MGEYCHTARSQSVATWVRLQDCETEGLQRRSLGSIARATAWVCRSDAHIYIIQPALQLQLHLLAALSTCLPPLVPPALVPPPAEGPSFCSLRLCSSLAAMNFLTFLRSLTAGKGGIAGSATSGGGQPLGLLR